MKPHITRESNPRSSAYQPVTPFAGPNRLACYLAIWLPDCTRSSPPALSAQQATETRTLQAAPRHFYRIRQKIRPLHPLLLSFFLPTSSSKTRDPSLLRFLCKQAALKSNLVRRRVGISTYKRGNESHGGGRPGLSAYLTG